MKKSCLRTLAFALCAVLAAFCALADNGEIFPQRLEEGNFRSLADLAAVGDTVYFLVYHGEGMEIWSWKEGGETELEASDLVRASAFSSIEGAEAVMGPERAKYAVGCIFTEGGRLLGFNPLSGLVFEIRFEDAETICTDVVTATDTAMCFRNTGRERWYSNPMEVVGAGGYMYWFGSGWDDQIQGNHQCITRISLVDGTVSTVPVEEVSAISRCGDERLLILTRQYDEKSNALPYAVSLYDPADGSLTEAGRIDTPRGLSRIAWCDALDALIWQDGTNIMGMQLDGEAQRYAYIPSTVNGNLITTGTTLVFAATRVTLARELVPGISAPQSLQVMNATFDPAAESFTVKYADVPVEIIGDRDDLGYAALFNPINGGERLDVVRLYTTTEEGEFIALRDEGMLLDLSSDPEIASYVASLYPPFRELVTGENGEIWAVPTETVSYSGFFINRKAMTDMGFTVEDMPTNMIELCAFINMWDTEYADRFPNYCCIEYAENTRSFLTDMAVSMWIGHCQASGQPIRFDDPEFRSVLEAIAGVSTVRTDRGMQVTNPEISDYKAGLFWIDCQLVGNWAAYMEDYSDRIFIPFTLTENTPFHARVDGVELWVVNRNTESAEYSMLYLREQMAQVNDKYAHVLLTTRTEPVENPYYAESLGYAQRKLGELQVQLLSVQDPDAAAEIQRQIAAQEVYMATELKRTMYSVTPSAVDHYVNVLAPAMYIHRENVIQDTSDGVNAMEYIRDRWLKGAITTEQFIREADTRMLMLEMGR